MLIGAHARQSRRRMRRRKRFACEPLTPALPSARMNARLFSIDDLRPAIASRPAGRLATRVVKHFPGRTPAVLPPKWLEPITDGTTNP
jgi:hypothetical protein